LRQIRTFENIEASRNRQSISSLFPPRTRN
jgi:hypothetical protein